MYLFSGKTNRINQQTGGVHIDISIGGLIGTYVGMFSGLLVLWLTRRKLKQEGGLDEVYVYIRQKSKANAWYVTLGLIYLFLTLNGIGVEMRMAMVLALLLAGHLGTWGITAIIMSVNLSRDAPLKLPYKTGGIALIILSVIICTIITITTQVWWYLLISIPFIAGGIMMTIMIPKLQK